ncbi:ABC transporter substrate-binding protein [Plantactinospora sp. KBS50]|uniref:ABC transporter substrate-binding protein n=1 Tax=Plantactinospora sp. KBS50 TaxID=2024580 RepID=UPI0012FDD151|nr:ABC transporter substrate-binding protein [Plantactinospora sp. KBS50]
MDDAPVKPPSGGGQVTLTRRGLLRGGTLAGLFALSPSLLAACGGGGASGSRGNRLVIAIEGDPRSLNEIIDPGIGIRILTNTQDGLLNRSTDYREIVAGLADMPERPDDLTYRFTLREGMTFNTGTAVTADDVVYTFNRLMTDEQASFGALYKNSIASVTAENDRTVVIKTKEPYPILMSLLSGNHPKIVEKAVVEQEGYGTTVWSGTGPFEVTEWVKGDHVTVRKAEKAHSPQGEAQVDEVVFRVIPDVSARLAALRGGQVDAVIQPAYKDLQSFKDADGIEIKELEGSDQTLMVFKTSMPPFDKRDVRKAISLGINRKALVEDFFYGHATAAGDLFPPWHWAHDPSIDAPYDPDQAKQLLAKAGFDESRPLKFTAMVLQDQLFLDQATAIQAQLREIGVEMEVKPVEYTTLSGITTKGPDKWLGPAAMYRITPIRGTAYEFANYQYAAAGPLNRSDFNKEGGAQRPDIEKLMVDTAKDSDWGGERDEAVKPRWAEVSRMLNDDPPQLLLNYWNRASLVSDHVEGWSSAVFDLIQLQPMSVRQ